MSKVKFRPYQIRMIQAQDNFMACPDTTRATILCATGGGKTECFQDLILKVINAKANGATKICVAHPRIALSQNQQKRFAKTFEGMGVQFANFHSGQAKTHTLSYKKNLSTTRRDELEEDIQNSSGVHITFASYASLHKIADMDFDLIICDEAQYLVQKDIRDNLHKFKSKTLFYTATPVTVAAREESMDNPELFGDVICAVEPKELIPHGYIVKPRVRTIDVLSTEDGNTDDYTTTIAEAFKDQLQFTHKKFTHKMLVAMPNVQHFSDIAKNLFEIRSIIGNDDVDLYYVTAERAVKNGTQVMDREALIEDFGKNPNQSIILHCDTLAEGIDVDGIGGVLIMRGLGMVKTIQTIGRGCRPAWDDVIKSGSRKGEIRKNRIKTECIVTVARFNGEWAGDQDVAWWAQLFETAGYDKGEMLAELEENLRKSGPAGDIGDPDETEWNEVLAYRCTEGQESFYKWFTEEAA